jgi:HSP20 family protein
MIEKTHTAGWWPHFYEPLRNIGQKVADWFAPRSDASASAEAYEINVELPGVQPDDVEVSLDDNTLVVRGEKRFEREESGKTYFFSEREYGAFQRTFRLPPDADSESIDAAFSDGVLTLKIAKLTAKQPAARTIKVKKG